MIGGVPLSSPKPFWQIRQEPFYGKLFSYEVASYQDIWFSSTTIADGAE